ncbi:MAG: hypothetical protein D3926_00555 [Desulfobacteraceae bacterium]|nr:MAG: hypothetical protein D3926_00555 [Desulfobacteraceae bacterium]
MAVKLNHYWAVIPGKYEEYEKFVLNEFIPGVTDLGLHTVAAWSVLVGAYSEIVLENASDDLELVEKTLRNESYKSLKRDLLKLVKSYQTKVLMNTGKVPSYSREVQEGTIKFNQMWDIQSQKKAEYEDYVTKVYFPTLNDLGVSVAGEWEVLIGDGPGIICEGRVTDYDNLIGNLQSKEFRRARQGLRQLIENYRSRILTFHVTTYRLESLLF